MHYENGTCGANSPSSGAGVFISDTDCSVEDGPPAACFRKSPKPGPSNDCPRVGFTPRQTAQGVARAGSEHKDGQPKTLSGTMVDVLSLALYAVGGSLIILFVTIFLEWPSTSPKLYKLPKASIWGYGLPDLKVVYHEMFEMKSRLSNSVVLRPNDVVIDGGANLGMFSMSLLQSNPPPGVTVHAFEPMPPTYEAALKNLAAFPQVKLYNVGLSNTNREENFHWSPAATCNAAPEGHIRELFAGVKSKQSLVMERVLQTNLEADIWPAALCKLGLSALRVPVLGTLVSMGMFYHVAINTLVRILTTKKMDVTLITVPEMLKLTGVKSIGLMKLDVEGAELEILEGMTEDCWSRVDQLWIEVHDVRDRVNVIKGMLTSRGYTVTVSKDDLALLDVLPIYALFATRR